jgi:hypothetical protein
MLIARPRSECAAGAFVAVSGGKEPEYLGY